MDLRGSRIENFDELWCLGALGGLEFFVFLFLPLLEARAEICKINRWFLSVRRQEKIPLRLTDL